jgi:hypothetical protein
MANNNEIIVSTGQTGGGTYYDPDTGTTKSTIIASADDLYKLTWWIWGGNVASTSYMSSKKCLSKSAITQSTYNTIKVASGTSTSVSSVSKNLISFESPSSGYSNNRLIRRDDIQVMKIPIAVEVVTSLTQNPDPFTLQVYLASTSSSTTNIKTLGTLDIDAKKNDTYVNYFTITLSPDYMKGNSTIFSRDAYICVYLDGTDWYYSRYLGFGFNKIGQAIVNKYTKKTSAKVKEATFNLGVTWREFIANGCVLHVRIDNNSF